jgi:DNA-binding transcriptional LysR family regulator
MDTLKIKTVLAAAKYKSFSRAAEEFSYTPSAFSHTVSAFEKQLGVRLFKRSSVGVELTRDGERLIPYFEAVIAAEKELFCAAAGASENGRYELKIGTYSSISRNYLTELLKDFKGKNRDIDLSVSVADDLRGWLEEGRADIVFADEKVLLNNNFVPILEDIYYVIAPEGYFPQRECVGREELYGYTYIDTDDTFSAGYFDKKRFSERIYFKSEDDLSVINAVRAGMGFAILPELVLKENLHGVTVLRLEPSIVRRLGFAYKKRAIESAALSRFVKYLKDRHK